MKTGLMLSLALLLTVGCSQTSESARRHELTAHVGKYDMPPAGLKRVRVGVPQFQVDTVISGLDYKRIEVSRDAADQLTTLADKTDRFEMIERAQMDQLLKEQGLEGVVDPAELAKPGRVRGVDYLFIGRITNMRVKKERTASSFSLGKLLTVNGASVFDYNNKKSTVTVECGVYLRLVDPTTGTILASDFGEFKRTDTIGATGVKIIGVGGQSDADLKINEDSRGLILRLALDDAVRKMLPLVDRRMLRKQAEETPEMPEETPETPEEAPENP